MASEGEIDNVVEVTPWDITVRSATQRHHAHQLVERIDADALIRSLGGLEAYYAIKALGPDDAAPFLAVIKPEQIRTLLDIEIWHAGRFEPEDLLIWFDAFREVGILRLQAAAKSMDREALAMLFRRRLLIALAPVDDDPSELPDWCNSPPDALLPIVHTPDRRYLIAARTEDELEVLEGDGTPLDEESRKAIIRLVDDLYRDEDFDDVASVLRMAEADLTSALEEDALRFCDARLEDLGFAPLSRAIEVYGLVDPDSILEDAVPPAPANELRLPALYVQHLSDGLLQAALREIDEPTVVRAIESALVPLANAACVADHVEPGNLEGVEGVLERMRGYIELALSYRASQSELVLAAARRLETHSVRQLFAAGYSITRRLANRAAALVSGGAFARDGDPLGLLDDDDRAVLEALDQRRPMYSTGAEGAELLRPAQRPFRQPQDVARTAAVLDALAAVTAVAAAMGGLEVPAGPKVAPPAQEHSLGLLLATITAHWLVDGALSLAPFDARQLARLRRALGDDADFEGAAAALAEAAGAQPSALLVERLRRSVQPVAESLVDLHGADAIDPRFVDGVLREISG